MTWQAWPDTEKYIQDVLVRFLDHCPKGRMLAELVKQETDTQLIHWVDYISLGGGEQQEKALKDVGYVQDWTHAGLKPMVMRHRQADFPAFVVRFAETASDASVIRVAIRCDSLAKFRDQFGCKTLVKGSINGYLAECTFDVAGGHNLIILERHGCRNILPIDATSPRLIRIVKARELCGQRPRFFDNDAEGMIKTKALFEDLISLVGSDLAAAIILEHERQYWCSHNEAAQLQKSCQDKLGLGWANNDHHTFRSSRQHFAALIKIFERLGFVCRERFYAGMEAGWGAQILEHPTGGIIFADVDLAPTEVDLDFAHQPLEPLSNLGDIGLWCALHGESILQAGLYHQK